jgi:type I restriction enzyme S subunit
MASEIALKKDAGTIMDSLNVKGIVKLSVPVPPPKVIEQFEANVAPIRRHIELAVTQNRNLRTTRDFLLPKLISGEVPVEAADEAAAELVEQTA